MPVRAVSAETNGTPPLSARCATVFQVTSPLMVPEGTSMRNPMLTLDPDAQLPGSGDAQRLDIRIPAERCGVGSPVVIAGGLRREDLRTAWVA